MSQALVLGSGVIGLWTASILSENGYAVDVMAGADATSTTSAAAACVLVPFLPGDPASPEFRRSVGWARDTVAHMTKVDQDGSLLQRMQCFEFGLSGVIEYGFSVDTLRHLDFSDFSLIRLDSIVEGCDMAVQFECYLCDSVGYLEWLVEGLARRGVSFRRATIKAPDDIPWKQYDHVFNCLGYQTIFPDPELYPVLGQSFFVPTDSPVSPGFGLGSGDHAVFAQRRGFHVGAHFLSGVGEALPRRDLYLRSLEFVSGPYRALCTSVGLRPPEIDLQAITRLNVGIRPFRKSGPRVERDEQHPKLVHNYGHGAHGWTTGYGSTLEAVRLAQTNEK